MKVFKHFKTVFVTLTFFNHLVLGLPCSENTKRYCKDGEFTPEFGYEFFEGIVPISQTGVIIKQFSDLPEHQFSLDNHKTAFTHQTTRISQIWHFPDIEMQETDVINELHKTVYPQNDWFAGDVIPFKTCVYVVKMTTGFENDLFFTRYTFQ